jgi:hypothetical protein
MVYKEGLQKAGPFVTVLPQVRCEGPAPDLADLAFHVAFFQSALANRFASAFDNRMRKVGVIICVIGGTFMRIFGLLVLLCGMVAVCGAVDHDQARQSASAQTAVASSNADFERSAGIVRPDFSGLATGDRDRRRFDADRDGDVTCYTIESYLVKRSSRDSDVVEPAGHSTCQRASKYGVKAAEESGKAPAR